MQGLRDAGVTAVLSLLTPEEERELDLTAERREANTAGLTFLSLPVPDLQVPSSLSEVSPFLEELNAMLSSGGNAVVHCRQGVGRSGMIAACLLVLRGQNPESAIQSVKRARGVAVPETAEQRRWIDLFSSSLTHTG
jgi:protein-tyrosine phosphatase